VRERRSASCCSSWTPTRWCRRERSAPPSAPSGAGGWGGGGGVRFDGPVPLYAAILERAVLPVLLPLLKMAPGCFLFCTRRAYLAAGGFDEALAWSEEVAFGNRLKRQGRFVILREFVITSGRKVRAHSALGLLRVGARLALGRRSGLDLLVWPAGRCSVRRRTRRCT